MMLECAVQCWSCPVARCLIPDIRDWFHQLITLSVFSLFQLKIVHFRIAYFAQYWIARRNRISAGLAEQNDAKRALVKAIDICRIRAYAIDIINFPDR